MPLRSPIWMILRTYSQMYDEVYGLIYQFLGYGVFFSAIDAIGTPLQGILRAYKDVKVVLYISLVSYWGVCFPTAYILAKILIMDHWAYGLGYSLVY